MANNCNKRGGMENVIFSMLLILSLLASGNQLYAASNGNIANVVVTPSELLTSNGSVNFTPITFRVDAPGGVATVEWINQPLNVPLTFTLKTTDGVTYRLLGSSAYRAIIDSNLANLQFQVTSNSGVQSLLTIPLSFAADPAPAVSFANATPLVLHKGQQTQLGVQLNDAGKNILSLRVLLAPNGTPAAQGIVVGGKNWGRHLQGMGGEVSIDGFDEVTGPIDKAAFALKLALSIDKTVAPGNYQLYIQAQDGKGNVMLSAPRTTTVQGAVVPPVLNLSVPTYRIPAGNPYPVHYQVKHLDKLARIEFIQTGPATNPVTQIVTLADNVYDVSGTAYLTLPAGAVAGDSVNINATVYDVNGNSSATLASVSAGNWGERTVTVSNTASVDVDESMNFANVTLSAGSLLRHVDGNIRFNNLTIESGAHFESAADTLGVHAALTIDGELHSAMHYSAADYLENVTQGGAHGGDRGAYSAYGDFRQPQFPGTFTSNSTYIANNLHIIASSMTVNGVLQAGGATPAAPSAPGAVLKIDTSNLALNGTIAANGSQSAAGGAVNINSTSMTGSGSITADGSDGANNGAGGRIAIRYGSYNNAGLRIEQGLTLHAYPGAPSGTYNPAGAGTIFLKRSDQLYGELSIDNGARNGGTTSLRAIGRHTIQSIEAVVGQLDEYRITLDSGYAIPVPRSWNLGVKGLRVSLNANDPAAPLVSVIDTVADSGAIDIQAARTLAAAHTPGSIQFHSIVVAVDQTLDFEITQANFDTSLFLFRDDGALDASDWLADNTNNGTGNNAYLRKHLTAGHYLLAVGQSTVSRYDALGDTTPAWMPACDNCSYTLRIRKASSKTLLVKASSDITVNTGNDLIGVIRLDKFSAAPGTVIKSSGRVNSDAFAVSDPASIRQIAELYSSSINNIGDTTLTDQSRVYVGDVVANNLVLAAATLKIYGTLKVGGNLTIQNSSTANATAITADALNVTGNTLLQDASLILRSKNPNTLNGDLTLAAPNQASLLTVPKADPSAQKLYPLLLNVTGQVSIDANSSIDVSGKGYPGGKTIGFNNYLNSASHGGEGGIYNFSSVRISDPGYGDFIDPQFGGAGGSYQVGGGGILKLNAGSLLLNGRIFAEGTDNSSAGGSIHISTGVFSGSGSISASAGDDAAATTVYQSAAGGRISVSAQIDNFSASGQTRAAAGRVTVPALFAQGAPGTVYLRSAGQATGLLKVDASRNASPQVTDRRTVLRSVGDHVISAVQSLGNDRWRITVAGTPWSAPTASVDGLGLIGLHVDLDAANETGTQYRIEDNDSNSITVNTSDDLSLYNGKTLIGVINVAQLSVRGGARLYTSDRLVIENTATLQLDAQSQLTVGQMNAAAATVLLGASGVGTLEFLTPYSTSNLNLTGSYVFSGGLTVTNNLSLAASASLTVSRLDSDQLTLNGGSISADTLNTRILTVNGGKVNALNLNVTNASANNALLSVDNINASGNLTLGNGASITVPDATDARFHALHINVAGTLDVALGTLIDLNGKGYTDNYRYNNEFLQFRTWNGGIAHSCHGGRAVSEQFNAVNASNINLYGPDNCVYGEYRHAHYAGLANYTGDPGGGYGAIIAGDLIIDGRVRANGVLRQGSYNSYAYEGPAGGGLHIDAANLSGTGSIEARGDEDATAAINYYGGWYWSGAGGRISVSTTLSNTFTGSYDAGAGVTGTRGATGGSGTVFLRDQISPQGQLIIDNFHRQESITASALDIQDVRTVIPGVGRHTVSAATAQGAGLWRIRINPDKLDNISQAGSLATPQAVDLHKFSLQVQQDVRLSVDTAYHHTLMLFRDDGNLDATDYVADATTRSYQNGIIETPLPAGNYLLAIASGLATQTDILQGNNASNTRHVALDPTLPDASGAISYTLHIDPTLGTWPITAEQGITGHVVSLNADDPNSPLYPIVSNHAESIVVDTGNTGADLSTLVGKDLIGVHTLASLQVRGGSVADFGNDRLVLLQPLQSAVAANSTLAVGDLDKATLEALLSSSGGKIIVNANLNLDVLTLSNAWLKVKGQLNLSGDLNLGVNATLTASAIKAHNVRIDNATVSGERITTGGNLDILNGGLLTVADARIDANNALNNRIVALDLNIAGTINIDAQSSINLDGKGYPNYYHGPDFASDTTNYSCHGGKRNNTTQDCTYGSYRHAMFAGSGGGSNTEAGGGSASLHAAVLNNNGRIVANGVGSSNGGAGGAIHVAVTDLSGSGVIEANGGLGAGGGRISVTATGIDSFTGSGIYRAASGINTTRVGGAGTVYLQTAAFPNGNLVTDNLGKRAADGSTPLRHIGRHTISNAVRNGSTITLTVAGSPNWRPSDVSLGWGFGGMTVDLDARDQSGTLYKVVSNSPDALVIDDSATSIADPSLLIGQDLIGVQVFDRLQVLNGASVDFGGDRVVINHAVNTDFSNAGRIRMGEINGAALNILLQQLGTATTLELQGPVAVNALNHLSGNLIVQGDMTVATHLTLGDTATLGVFGRLRVNGDIAIAASAVLTAPDAQAANLLIDGGTLQASVLNISNNITLLSSNATGVLTVPAATLQPKRVYPLVISAGNAITINTGALIDVNGKGYPGQLISSNSGYFVQNGGPDFNYQDSVSCHAGQISTPVSNWQCLTYGRLEQARFAGSAGQYYSVTQNGNGGGSIRISANSLNNSGTLRADGNSGTYGGAGGSVHLAVNSLTGTGVFSANGGTPLYAYTSGGGGGRISLDLPDVFANGIDMNHLQAHGGVLNGSANIAGAGTVYLKYANESHGRLVVDNAGNNASLYSTPSRKVNRCGTAGCVINSVSNNLDGTYTLRLGANNALHLKQTGVVTQTGVDSVVEHRFTLNAARKVKIEITDATFSTHIYLFEDTGTSLRYISNDTSSGNGNLSRIVSSSLPAGNYLVAVSGYYTQQYEASSGSKSNNGQNYGPYTLRIDTRDDTWHASDPVYGWGLDGLSVTLDAANPAASLYPIVSNDEASITVSSPSEDLTTLVTPGITTFLGIHQFETLIVRGGAQLDFGADRVIVRDTVHSLVETGSAVSADPGSTLP